MSKFRQRFQTVIGSAVVRPAGASVGDHFVVYQADSELINAHILEISTLKNFARSTTDGPSLTLQPFLDTQASNIFRVTNAANTLDLVRVLASGRVLVKPGADAESLTLQPFSDAQLSNIFRVTNAGNTLDLVRVLASGRVIVKPGADAESVTLQPFSDTQASSIFRVTDVGNAAGYLQVGPTGRVSIGNGVISAGGVKHQRITANGMAIGENLVTVTWITAFADNNYTTGITWEDTDSLPNACTLKGVAAKSATGFTARVFNGDTAVRNGILHAMAFHD